MYIRTLKEDIILKMSLLVVLVRICLLLFNNVVSGKGHLVLFIQVFMIPLHTFSDVHTSNASLIFSAVRNYVYLMAVSLILLQTHLIPM